MDKLDLAILVPNNSLIMLVNILLFQHYSHQIYSLLFSKLFCWSIGSGLHIEHQVAEIRHYLSKQI